MNYLKKLSKYSIFLLIILGVYSMFSKNNCSSEEAQKIAIVYISSTTLSQNHVSEFMDSNLTDFRSNSSCISCMKNAGKKIRQAGIDLYDPRLKGKSRDSSKPHPQNEHAFHLQRMGEHLIWLARVLPDAALRDWEAYENKETTYGWGVNIFKGTFDVHEINLESFKENGIYESEYYNPFDEVLEYGYKEAFDLILNS